MATNGSNPRANRRPHRSDPANEPEEESTGTDLKSRVSDGVVALRPIRKAAQEKAERILEQLKSNAK